MLRLKRVLDTKSMTMKGTAELLGISEKTLYNKMVGISDFTYRETQKLKSLFPEYNLDYLLAEDVAVEQGA